ETDVTAVEEGDGEVVVCCSRDDEEFRLPADAVIRAPGRNVDTDMLEDMGLAVSRRGVDADRDTGAVGVGGVFAAGEVVRGSGATVRAVASGRKAAAAIHQFLRGKELTGEREPVNSKLGRLEPGEEEILLDSVERRGRTSLPRRDSEGSTLDMEETEETLSREDATGEAARCLDCDCLDKHGCKLRRHATTYDASTTSYRGDCRGLERDDSHPTVVYEPGKCILCGLCVRIAGEPDEGGLTFVNRGFDTRTRTPFGSPLGEALSVEQAEECAKACPTGALARRRKPAESAAREAD
ncbi:MAG: FAD-dependent oxidoreductase, partial [Planctomycetota bacterium]